MLTTPPAMRFISRLHALPIALVFLAATGASADILVTQSGRRYEGAVTQRVDGCWTIELSKGGTLTFPPNVVTEIIRPVPTAPITPATNTPTILPAVEKPLHLQTAPPSPARKPSLNVDEQLYLTYVLDDLYSSWPTDMSNPQSLQAELANLRYRANRFHEYAKAGNFDPRLTSLYADCLTAIDTYAVFLADMGHIEREALARLENERNETGFNAGFAGGSTAASDYDNGASGGDALLSGLAVGVMQWLLDDYGKGQERDETKRAAIEAAGRDLQDKLSAIAARLENIEPDLAARYGWDAQELRSADPADETQQWEELAKSGDIQGEVQLINRKIMRRPRDARLLALGDYVETLDAYLAPSAMKTSAERCVTRAALVPDGRIYDIDRARILYCAADIANRAWTKELDGRSWGTAKSPLAAYAVELWDAVLKYYPGDDDGQCREQRAWALMASGRLNEAVAQANDVIKQRANTLRYAINYARLMSATGDSAQAFNWFQYAVKTLGFNAIAYEKSDPDLSAMRLANARAFDDLTAVKWSWGVQWGLLHDDITVTNSSAFAITGVDVSFHIVSGDKEYTPRLTCDLIKPGETHKWVNAVTIPGSQMDANRSTVILECDQSK